MDRKSKKKKRTRKREKRKKEKKKKRKREKKRKEKKRTSNCGIWLLFLFYMCATRNTLSAIWRGLDQGFDRKRKGGDNGEQNDDPDTDEEHKVDEVAHPFDADAPTRIHTV